MIVGTPGVKSVAELLSDSALRIPDYQRPYKWTEKNIAQLFADLATFKDQKSYRLGTIVFHQEPKTTELNIVDGQQRTITLLLACRALINERLVGLKNLELEKTLTELEGKMVDPIFTNTVSQRNIHRNYSAICRIVKRSDFTEELIDFLLNKCEFVFFTLDDVSEAFQFFDSQNARGRDLAPHDLLKAYHLREFNEGDEQLKLNTVAHWEDQDTSKLVNLFGNYLFRTRNWARGHSARFFGKDNVGLFKGVNLDESALFPHMNTLRIAHHFVDEYNGRYDRKIDGQSMEYPFQLDQTVVNGRRFFEMIAHYQKIVDDMPRIGHSESLDKQLNRLRQRLGGALLDPTAIDVFRTLDSYDERWRTGDRYVRQMFDCLLLFYIDKFGAAEISLAVEKCFVWAYRLRLQRKRLPLASMDNYARENNMFLVLSEAIKPADFLNHPLPVFKGNNNNNGKLSAIKKLLRTMNYYE